MTKLHSHLYLWLMIKYRMIRNIDKASFALHYRANVNEKSIIINRSEIDQCPYVFPFFLSLFFTKIWPIVNE